jgi:DNA-binding NtrC family response regulator
LVIEDDPHCIKKLRRLFSGNELECEVALNMDTADQVLAERKMEAVVVDLTLDGIEEDGVIEKFKAPDTDRGLILFNGDTKKSVQRRYRRRGADSYLSEKSDLKAVARATRRVIFDGAS